MNSTSTTEHKTEHKYTLVNQTVNIHKSNKGVTNLKTPQEKGKIHYLYLQPKNRENVKLYNKKNKQNHKINATSLKEDKIYALVSKLLAENHNEPKKTVHHKLKDLPFFT